MTISTAPLNAIPLRNLDKPTASADDAEDQLELDSIHDFATKLVQPGAHEALDTYVRWQVALRSKADGSVETLDPAIEIDMLHHGRQTDARVVDQAVQSPLADLLGHDPQGRADALEIGHIQNQRDDARRQRLDFLASRSLARTGEDLKSQLAEMQCNVATDARRSPRHKHGLQLSYFHTVPTVGMDAWMERRAAGKLETEKIDPQLVSYPYLVFARAASEARTRSSPPNS
jgi:hypothetical protein